MSPLKPNLVAESKSIKKIYIILSAFNAFHYLELPLKIVMDG